MRGWYIFFCTVFLLLGLENRKVYALSVDVNDHQVGIYLDFSGSSTTLFGSVEDGENIAVVILGPRENVRLYKKERSFGVWTNKKIAELLAVPGYYYFSMNSRFLLKGDSRDELALVENEVGLQNLNIQGEGSRRAKKHLIGYMKDKGLYEENYNGIRLVDKNLFKMEIPIPRNAPTGVYTIRVLTFGSDNYYHGTRVLPMFVRKQGLIAFVSHHARVNALYYGVGIVLLSLLVGVSIVLTLRRLK